jgi:hypothetical protein
MPIVAAIWEVKIERIMVQDQPRKNVRKIPSQHNELDMVKLICHHSSVGDARKEDHRPRWS